MFIVENLDGEKNMKQKITLNFILPSSDNHSQYVGQHLTKR